MSSSAEKHSDEFLMSSYSSSRLPQYFEIVYNRYFKTLCRYLTWLMKDEEKSKDLTQIIFLKLYDHPELYNPDYSFKVWLFVIARNRWKNEKRNQANQRKHLDMISHRETFSTANHEEVDKSLEIDLVKRATHLLSLDHREVIILKYSNNLTIAEISEVLSCKEGTVKSRLFHAIKNLKKLVNEIR